MNAVKIGASIEELKTLHVPGCMAGIRHDLEVLHRGDKALRLFLEVFLVAERQARLGLLNRLDRKLGWCLALGMEVSRQRGCHLLSVRGVRIQNQMSGHRRGGARSKKCLDKLSPRRHRHPPMSVILRNPHTPTSSIEARRIPGQNASDTVG